MKCSIFSFTLTNSADPDEMQHNSRLVLKTVLTKMKCTVCQSTSFGFSGIERVNNDFADSIFHNV